MNITMKKICFLSYLIFCIGVSFDLYDIFNITINIKKNVIRLYDYFIMGGLFVWGTTVLVKQK